MNVSASCTGFQQSQQVSRPDKDGGQQLETAADKGDTRGSTHRM